MKITIDTERLDKAVITLFRKIVKNPIEACPFCGAKMIIVGNPESQCHGCFSVVDHWTGELLGGFARDEREMRGGLRD